MRLHLDADLRRRVMTPRELDYLGAPLESITIWSGCHTGNRRGFSWATVRSVAEKFPFLGRYRRPDDGSPLLLQAVTERSPVLLVMLDRDEHEAVILPGAARVVAEFEFEETVCRT